MLCWLSEEALGERELLWCLLLFSSLLFSTGGQAMATPDGASAAAPQPQPQQPPSLRGRLSRQLRRHPGLIPLIGFIGLGLGSAALYLLRLAIYSPDVSWDRKNNPEPWNKLSPNDQYKFMAVSTDYKTLKKDRPDF